MLLLYVGLLSGFMIGLIVGLLVGHSITNKNFIQISGDNSEQTQINSIS